VRKAQIHKRLGELEASVAKRKDVWTQTNPVREKWRKAIRRLFAAVPGQLHRAVIQLIRSQTRTGRSLRQCIIFDWPLPEKIPPEIILVLMEEPEAVLWECRSCKLPIPYRDRIGSGENEESPNRYFDRCPNCETVTPEDWPMTASVRHVSSDTATSSHSRVEARLLRREPSRLEMIYRAAQHMSDGELQTIQSVRKNKTDELTKAQTKAITRLHALADEEKAKWVANESKRAEPPGRTAADDDDLGSTPSLEHMPMKPSTLDVSNDHTTASHRSP
jgi:hypothetical protein